MKLNGFVSLFVFAFMAGAQDQQTSHISGRLISPDPFLAGYAVQLDELTPRSAAPAQADVRIDGEFSLRNVPYGDYMLKVLSPAGDLVAQQLISLRDRESLVDIRIPGRPARPTGTTVSVRELAHTPARKAVEAAASAQRFAQSGHAERAAGELQKAIRISPDYAAAHSNLAVQYIRLARFDDARVEIERALDLAGPNPVDLANLAFAYAGLQRIDDAINAARRALAIDRNSAPAHYVLGGLLALRPETRAEAITHLELAADEIPSARRELEKYAH